MKSFNSVPNNPSDFEKYEDDYNRIHFILIELLKKGLIKNYFCIGGTEIVEKDNIYEYLLKVIVSDDGFRKMENEVYDKVGWGLYFSINI